MKDLRHCLLTCAAVCLLSLLAFAQTAGFREGDRVNTPDGRQGIIEAFKMPDMAKVKFDDGTTKFYIRADLKKIEPTKTVSNGPPESFRVGDAVVDPRTPERKYKIYSISGDSAVIFQDVGKYAMNTAMTVKLANIISSKTWERRQSDEKEAKLVRAAFEDEAEPFHEVVYFFAWAYKPQFKMNGGTIPQSAAEIAEMRKKFDSLAAVCQKYPGLTNEPGVDDPLYAGDINMHPADWCRMAEQREALVKKVLRTGGDIIAKDEISIWDNAIREAMRDPNGYVKDELQRLVFDRATFQQNDLKGVRESYAKAGEKIPDEILAPLFKQADELRAKIEQDVATRSWTQPAYKDAALEALVKAAYLKAYPGARIFNTGMTYATWKAYDDTSLIRSDSSYKVYKYEKDKYRQKDGLILVQLPNQPLCQIRNFTLQQTRTGAAFGGARPTGTAKGGIFVKCP